AVGAPRDAHRHGHVGEVLERHRDEDEQEEGESLEEGHESERLEHRRPSLGAEEGRGKATREHPRRIALRSGMPVFDDRFVRELPADLDETNVPRFVERACYTLVDPTPVRSPALVAASADLAASLGLTVEALGRSPWLDVLAGNDLLPG